MQQVFKRSPVAVDDGYQVSHLSVVNRIQAARLMPTNLLLLLLPRFRAILYVGIGDACVPPIRTLLFE